MHCFSRSSDAGKGVAALAMHNDGQAKWRGDVMMIEARNQEEDDTIDETNKFSS